MHDVPYPLKASIYALFDVVEKKNISFFHFQRKSTAAKEKEEKEEKNERNGERQTETKWENERKIPKKRSQKVRYLFEIQTFQTKTHSNSANYIICCMIQHQHSTIYFYSIFFFLFASLFGKHWFTQNPALVERKRFEKSYVNNLHS